MDASNALIANNSNRLGKSLWTQAGQGDLIDVFEARNETDEARYVVKAIEQLLNNQGANPNDCAILYRSNAQSRVFEEGLIQRHIPYIIHGGLRFFERAEIKNALSYLRLIENNADNVAFERVVNFPTRGIGQATLEKIRAFAAQNYVSFYQASSTMRAALSTRAGNALLGFVGLIETMQNDTKQLDLSEKITHLLAHSGLMEHHSNDKADKAGSKKANLEELIAAAERYQHEDEQTSEVAGFIALASLDSTGGNNAPEHQNVQLMTVHSAKGLEFPFVFLVGMEEDLFPSRQSKDEPHLMDEERRLCYVGMTRSMQKLSLSFALKRFLHGTSNYAYRSRFLDEIPEEYLNLIAQTQNPHNHNHSHNISAVDEADFDQSKTQSNSAQISIGANVKHPKFGLGTVLNFEGKGDSARVQVRFARAGTKWLICAYANLEFV